VRGLSRACALWFFAGCYQPAVPSGVPCTSGGECPAAQACVEGVCGGTPGAPDAPTAPPPDAPTAVDAAPDAPRVLLTIGTDPAHVRDTSISGDAPGDNFNLTDHTSVDAVETTLLWFDVTSVDANAAVVGATLRVTTADFAAADGGTVLVHRLREAWVEGEATWLARSTGLAWSETGALPPARDAAAIASLQPAALTTAYDIALPVELVQAWIDDPANNHGVALVRGTATGHVHLATREIAVGSSRLVIEIAP
jgi:hypothetical protein